MAERSPKHGLTRGKRGWYRRVVGVLRWICSDVAAPTGAIADQIFEDRFKELCKPAKVGAQLTVAELFNSRVAVKQAAADVGAIGHRVVGDYADAGQRLVDVLGKPVLAARMGPGQFSAFAGAIAKYSPSRRKKLVDVVKGVFKWAVAGGIIPGPVDFGPDLKPPRKSELRIAKAKRGSLEYKPAEIHKLLGKATRDLKAAILLALNGGVGNQDIASFPRDAVDGDWIKFPRGKTGVDRLFKCWPETMAAIEAVPRRHDVLLLVNPENALPWINESGRSHNDRLAVAFKALCVAADVRNLGFYSLRRTHRTVADEVGDQRAAAVVMGHDVGDIGGIYVQRISPERLIAITDHVRRRLLIPSPARGRRKTSGPGKAPVASRAGKRSTAPGRRG